MSISTNAVSARISVLTDIEVKAFQKRLKDVLVIEKLMDQIKKYGRGSSVDLGSQGTKKTKSNTTPDIIDLDLIDKEQALRGAMFELCRVYEETILESYWDKNGDLKQKKIASVANARFDTMIDYLSDDNYLNNWMRFQQDFDDDVELLLVAIRKAERHVTPREKPVKKKTVTIDMSEKFKNSEHDKPMVPVALKRMLAKDYPITTKDIRNWATRGLITRHEMPEGNRDGYIPSEVISVYNKMVTKRNKVA